MENFVTFRKVVGYTCVGIIFLISIIFLSSFHSWRKYDRTEYKMYDIISVLYHEFQDTNEYPYDISYIEHILRSHEEGNPLKDDWGNSIFYERNEDKKGFVLISKGKDGVLFTDDDLDFSYTGNFYNH